MMIRAPWIKTAVGVSTTALVSQVQSSSLPCVTSEDYGAYCLQLTASTFAEQAELVDMYPTALELTGLPAGLALSEHLEGNSLVPVLKDPSLHLKPKADGGAPGWKQAVFSQYPRCMNSTIAQQPPYLPTRDACIGHNANEVTHMGCEPLCMQRSGSLPCRLRWFFAD